MMLFLLMALVACSIAALVWWGIRGRGARPLVAMLIALMLLPLPAMAGALDTLVAAAAPHLLELIGLSITAIIGWAAAAVRRKWGIEIEARHRDAMHYALYTGAQLALERKLTGKAAIDLILEYVRRSVPDALGNLKPSAETLTDLAKAKLQTVAAEKVKEMAGDAVDKLAEALHRAGARA